MHLYEKSRAFIRSSYKISYDDLIEINFIFTKPYHVLKYFYDAYIFTRIFHFLNLYYINTFHFINTYYIIVTPINHYFINMYNIYIYICIKHY